MVEVFDDGLRKVLIGDQKQFIPDPTNNDQILRYPIKDTGRFFS